MYLNSQKIFPEKEKEIIFKATLILSYVLKLILMISMCKLNII